MNNKQEKIKVAVVGLGYVGTSISVLISQKYEVVGIDIDKDKIRKINNKESPIHDNEITEFLKNKNLNIKATKSIYEGIDNAKYIIICTPTDFDSSTNSFNTQSIESVLDEINNSNQNSTIIIKSTVPIGFTEKMNIKFPLLEIIFSPEFLREGKALYDNLYPSRIVVGGCKSTATKFGKLMKSLSKKESTDILLVSNSEAEAIKLFSNTFLAMRVAFFNELDNFAIEHDLSSEMIIRGVCLDERVGDHYNNPSFGYGGYCLPKDTKQLVANFKNTPNKLISSIDESNDQRKLFISNQILKKNPKVIGIYRLIMKSNSDNFRVSAILDIVNLLKKQNVNFIIYEPLLGDEDFFDDIKVESDINSFMENTDIIIANRIDKIIQECEDKIFTRDIFLQN